jgi:hypothetical protein
MGSDATENKTYIDALYFKQRYDVSKEKQDESVYSELNIGKLNVNAQTAIDVRHGRATNESSSVPSIVREILGEIQ